MGAQESRPVQVPAPVDPVSACCCLSPPQPCYFHGKSWFFCIGPGGGPSPHSGFDTGSPDAGYGPYLAPSSIGVMREADFDCADRRQKDGSSSTPPASILGLRGP